MFDGELGQMENDDDEYIDASDAKVADPTGERNYMCDGILIRFPYTAYESQKEMMKEIIAGVQNSENCLLESPTGTGKTATLLCSLLAWQQEFIKKVNANANEGSSSTSPSSSDLSSSSASCSTPRKNLQSQPTQKISIQYELTEKPVQNQKPPEKPEFLKNVNVNQSTGSSDGASSSSKHPAPPPLPTIPVIYYATRTHTQIKSVVTQLKKTAYSHIPMTILGSREQCCVNPSARKTENGDKATGEQINKFCENHRLAAVVENKKMKKDNQNGCFIKSTCSYYEHEDQADFADLIWEKGGEAAVDIEDLVTYGKEHVKCPYYGTKELQKSARIIFCTYNHLLQRSVRSASRVQFENSVFVFDEAHNIEAFCNTEGSSEISQEKVEEVRQVLDLASAEPNVPLIKREPLRMLTVAFTHLSKWLRDRGSDSERHLFQVDNNDGTWGKSKERWSRDLNRANFAVFRRDLDTSQNNSNSPSPCKRPRPDPNVTNTKSPGDLTSSFPEMMKEALFGPEDLRALWGSYFFLDDRHYNSNPNSDDISFKIDKKAFNFIGSFLSTLQYLFKTEKAGPINQNQVPISFPRLRDYKIELIKEFSKDKKVSMKLLLLCMNPGLVFEKMQSCRSVIVTSGTLSPLESFSTELNTPFLRTLSAEHVLPEDRVFVNVIKHLVPKRPLKLTYGELNKLNGSNGDDMRNDLGQIILSICKTVPHGILVFLPSKSMCRSLQAHFTNSGVIKEMEQVKGKVLWETDMELLNIPMQEMIAEYVESAKEREKGALLFAIFRGRVSEGVDFSDDQARAVITLGIPFLPFYDKGVVAKRTYNQRRYEAKEHCLNSNDWYQSSAFRAQNQAFGRCIRHSRDWGVISIVDTRFADPNNQGKLSRWVSNGIKDQVGGLVELLPKINQFVQRRLASV